MSPLKRVLLAIGLLVILMIAALLVSWHLQDRALSSALVNDVTATLTRPIERNPRLDSAKHENGYDCLSRALAGTPSDLRPVDLKDQGAFQQILDAGVVPEALQPNIAALEPWAQSMRDCGDSKQLTFVPGFTPFEPFDNSSHDPARGVMALARMTRLQVRLLSAEARWSEIAELCAGTLEVSLDFGHINLLGAMVANSTVHQLLRACAAPLQQLPTEARPPIAARFARLPSRLVQNAEFMEIERQLVTLNSYRHLLSAEQREKVPKGEDWIQMFMAEQPLARFLLPRIWARWDRALRELVEASRGSLADRKKASDAMDGTFSEWWMPGDLGTQPNYEKFFQRNDDTALLLKLFVELAGASDPTLSPRLVKTSEGLEFTKADGEKLVIPLVH